MVTALSFPALPTKLGLEPVCEQNLQIPLFKADLRQAPGNFTKNRLKINKDTALNQQSMNTTILSSTFGLTLLLAIGLFFFIRASIKDRTEQIKLISPEPEESLLQKLQQYFEQRAYRLAAVDATTRQVTFQGFVRPSWFMAIFLTVLAASGILCLALVLSILYPQFTKIFLGLVLLAPAAGIFYWQGAGRNEQVYLKVETLVNQETGQQNLITVTAHRDELAQLQQSLALQPLPESTLTN